MAVTSIADQHLEYVRRIVVDHFPEFGSHQHEALERVHRKYIDRERGTIDDPWTVRVAGLGRASASVASVRWRPGWLVGFGSNPLPERDALKRLIGRRVDLDHSRRVSPSVGVIPRGELPARAHDVVCLGLLGVETEDLETVGGVAHEGGGQRPWSRSSA